MAQYFSEERGGRSNDMLWTSQIIVSSVLRDYFEKSCVLVTCTNIEGVGKVMKGALHVHVYVCTHVEETLRHVIGF